VKAAAECLAKAEKDPKLTLLKNELAQDRKALGWVDDADKAMLSGAKQLKNVDTFTLHRKKGPPMVVGKRADFQVIEVKEGALEIGSKGLGLSVKFDDLHFHSRIRLALRGLGSDAAAQVCRAWLEMLAMSDGPSPATVEDVRGSLVRAKTAGAAEADLAYLQTRLEVIDKGGRELAATSAWEGLTKLEQEKQWKVLLTTLQAFVNDHGESALARQKAAEMAALQAHLAHDLCTIRARTFNLIGPGYIATELTRPLWTNDEFNQWVMAKTPLARWGRPEDIAKAVGAVAEGRLDYSTGQVINVDGGFHLRILH